MLIRAKNKRKVELTTLYHSTPNILCVITFPKMKLRPTNVHLPPQAHPFAAPAYYRFLKFSSSFSTLSFEYF